MNTNSTTPQYFVQDLFDSYKTQYKPSLIPADEDQIVAVLNEFYKFSELVGMLDAYNRYGIRIVYIIHHGPSFIEWLNPSSRLSRDLRYAIMLFILIQCSNISQLSQQYVDSIEDLIDRNKTRDRTTVAALLFFTKVLAVTQNSTLEFKETHFDIEETLIPEMALLTVFATFRVLTSLLPVYDQITEHTQRIFKLFYIYYIDAQHTLAYQDFININQDFFNRYGNNIRFIKFYFSTMTKILEGLKTTNIFDANSMYMQFHNHPFNLFSDFAGHVSHFCDLLQTQSSDYMNNMEQYSKEFKDIFVYIAVECNQAYLMAQEYDPDTVVDFSQVQTLASDTCDQILGLYFDYRLVPHQSILAMIKPGSGAQGPTGINMMDKMFDQALGFVKKTAEKYNHPVLNIVNHETTQSLVKMGLKSFNLGGIVQNTIMKKYVVVNFNFIAKGLGYFWKTFAKSNDFKKMAQDGDSLGILTNFLGVAHDPAMNLIRTTVDKLPFGPMINLNTTGTVLDGFLRQAKYWLTKNVQTSGPIFTAGSQILSDYTRTQPVSDAWMMKSDTNDTTDN